MADAFIALANTQSKQAIPGKVSVAFLYAAARFNTFLTASQSKAAFKSSIENSIEYYMSQYKKMLDEHFAELIVCLNFIELKHFHTF